MAIEIVRATLAHAERLAPRLRPADRAELSALGLHPGPHLRDAVRKSVVAYGVLLGGELAALAGVSPYGCAWCLTSNVVWRNKKGFLRASRTVLAKFQESYGGPLWNLVDARYDAAIRWVRWLGFTVGPVERGFRRIVLTKEAAWAA